MQFNSLEEFLDYYYHNNVKIGDVVFDFKATAGEIEGDPTVTPDVVAVPPEAIEEIQPEDLPDSPQGKIQESLVIHLASGDIQLELDDEGFVLVEDFSVVPNACGTGSITLQGRKIQMNMCEMDDQTIAYANTSRGHNYPMAVRRKT